YGRIAETAREKLGPPGSRLARAVLNFVFTRVLPYPRRLRTVALLLRWYQHSGLQRLILPLLPKKLRHMDSMLPRVPDRFFEPGRKVFPAIVERRAKVAMLNGCVMPLLFGEAYAATARVRRGAASDGVSSSAP